MHHVAVSAVCSPACSVVHEGSSPAHGGAPACVHRAARTPVRRVSFDAPPLCVVVGLQPVVAVVSKLTACDPALLVVQLLQKEHLCVVCAVQTGALCFVCVVLCLLRGLPERPAQCWDVVAWCVSQSAGIACLFTTPLVYTCWCKLWL